MPKSMKSINNGLNVGDCVYHPRLKKYGTIKSFTWLGGRRSAEVECDGDPGCVYVFNTLEIDRIIKTTEIMKPVKIIPVKISKMEPDENII